MINTTEIINRIKKSKSGEMSFLDDADYRCPQIHYYLADLLQAHNISGKEYIRALNLERSYGYQLLNGRRKPSREHLIQTAVLFNLDLKETQRLLKIGNREILYPRVKRDAIAVFAIEKGLSLQEYQEMMDAYEEQL